MIKTFTCEGVNGRINSHLDFQPDINIVVGKNGSGKTTLLKLLWYAISGNLARITREIPFRRFKIETDTFSLEMNREDSKGNRIQIKYQLANGSEQTRTVRGRQLDDYGEATRELSRASGASVFFPTFRRIEGGFSIGEEHYPRAGEYIVMGNSLTSAMNSLAENLTVGRHQFVCSISTNDIVRLLTTRYADISEKTNRLHTDFSQGILNMIRDASLDGQESRAVPLLEDIRHSADEVTRKSEALLKPFTVLSQLIETIFQYRGIRVADALTLGEAVDAVSSGILSAGEKQMLSFLCYNAFTQGSCVFIDEPEISLHVDWQRKLFPTLLEQSTGNQFIVATHSPFIFNKYADKELVLNIDRGE